MGSNSPSNSQKKPFLRIVLPIMVSFLLTLLPVSFQALLSFVQQNEIAMVHNAHVDLSGRERFDYQNRYIYGEVELFYNEWICSDDLGTSSEPPISFQTPRPWTGYPDADGNRLSEMGFASYRYYLTGLKPGVSIRAHANVEVPNRIYLNGVLCSQVGEPSKTAQSSLIRTTILVDEAIIVPENGVVTYVLEVGNTGDGGSHHIGSIYIDGTPRSGFTQYLFFPIAAGFLFAAIVIAISFVAVNRIKVRQFLIFGCILFEALLYLCSSDSFLIAAGLYFSLPIAELLSVFALGGVISLVVFYAYHGKFSPFKKYELALLTAVAVLSTVGYLFTHGTEISTVFLGTLAMVPLYALIKNFIALRRGFSDIQSIVLNVSLLSHTLLIIGFAMDSFGIAFIYYPTLHAILSTALLFSVAFYDVYQTSLAKKDDAMLRRRYQTISNRAFARLLSMEESIESLAYIGRQYDKSIAEGEHSLIALSTLLRRRITTLREEKISLKEECELEDIILKFDGKLRGYSASLVFDVEDGSFMLPPLLFEAAIAELAPFAEDESIVIVETKNGVQFLYPAGLELQRDTIRSILERCSLQGLFVRVKAHEILITEAVFQ